MTNRLFLPLSLTLAISLLSPGCCRYPENNLRLRFYAAAPVVRDVEPLPTAEDVQIFLYTPGNGLSSGSVPLIVEIRNKTSHNIRIGNQPRFTMERVYNLKEDESVALAAIGRGPQPKFGGPDGIYHVRIYNLVPEGKTIYGIQAGRQMVTLAFGNKHYKDIEPGQTLFFKVESDFSDYVVLLEEENILQATLCTKDHYDQDRPVAVSPAIKVEGERREED